MSPRVDRLDPASRSMPPRTAQAYRDYVALGPYRSLAMLCQAYCTQDAVARPPTRRLDTLRRWSREYGWQARILAAEQAETAAISSVRQQAITAQMAHRYADATARVASLNALAERLYTDLMDGGKLWTGTPRKPLFAARAVEQLRGLLDDIAKETGGRAKRIDIEVAIREDARRLGLDEDMAVAEALRILAEDAEAARL